MPLSNKVALGQAPIAASARCETGRFGDEHHGRVVHGAAFHPVDHHARTSAFLRSCMNLNPDNR